MNTIWKVLISLIFTATFGFITYKLVERHFDDPLFHDNVSSLKTLVKLEKKVHKNKASDDHKKEHKEIKDKLTETIKNNEHGKRSKNKAKFNKAFLKIINGLNDHEKTINAENTDEEAADNILTL